MENQGINNKNIAFGMGTFLAFAILWMEVEKTPGIDLPNFIGIGHFLTLLGLGASRITLFFLSGSMWERNRRQAGIVFAFSVILSVFFGYYIETLEGEGVFESGQRWTMHTANLALSFVEVAFSFTQTKLNERKSEIEGLKKDLNGKINEKENEIEALKEKLEAANNKTDDLERTLSANRKLIEHYNVIKAVINKPQKRGRWYNLITPEGLIVQCDKEGNPLKEALA